MYSACEHASFNQDLAKILKSRNRFNHIHDRDANFIWYVFLHIVARLYGYFPVDLAPCAHRNLDCAPLIRRLRPLSTTWEFLTGRATRRNFSDNCRNIRRCSIYRNLARENEHWKTLFTGFERGSISRHLLVT